MKLVQCWDDGVTTDVRLVSLLRRHGARATFNLNAGLHARQRQLGWHHRGTEVWRLGHGELREVYEGFGIANHTLTHPHLERLPMEVARSEIRDGRARLQDLFDQPVRGFAYPFGSFDDAVMQAVREAGHRYARTTRAAHAELPRPRPRLLAAARSCPTDRRLLVLGSFLRTRRRSDVGGLRGVGGAPWGRAWRAVVRPERPLRWRRPVIPGAAGLRPTCLPGACRTP
jgi:peptidoglycan/xylan/chitin deacetylase (PgdA/CDA1 family)